jgi:hypothetical protein
LKELRKKKKWSLPDFFSLCLRICRGRNTEFIRLAHLSWNNDALTILFSKAKNDQEGKYLYARHVYPNPLEPNICPILALAIYWAYLPLPSDASATFPLFPGPNQSSRYSS